MRKINDDQEYIAELFKLSENEIFDFKQNITNSSKIAKTLVAFANTKGGRILIGVSDQRKIIGIDAEEEIYMIEKAGKEYCEPEINPEFEILEYKKYINDQLFEDVYLLLVDIKASPFKHFAIDEQGIRKFYLRVDDHNIPQP
jgi:predicted HTH transcriptional regulator